MLVVQNGCQTVEQQTGPISYRCRLEDGRRVKRHQDQIIPGGSTQFADNPDFIYVFYM